MVIWIYIQLLKIISKGWKNIINSESLIRKLTTAK